ncbi:hypothetical protein [Bremerella cremea]|uniref:hypothetical protein n=1 Tax=Bremerella cremea TaxID=1031537 RepID=UPI0031F08D9E
MSLGTFAPGPYTATYDASGAVSGTPGQAADPAARDIGLVEGAHRLSRVMEGEDIAGTNLFGQTVVDSIYRGGNCFLLLTMKEWKPYVRDILWPFGSSFGDVGPIGRLLTDLAGKIVLTPVAGTPAYQNDGKVLTFGKAILSPQHNTEIFYGPAQRDVALVFRCFPYYNSDETPKLVWFEESDVE